MLNRLAAALFALLFSGGVWAMSCPNVMAELDAALEGEDVQSHVEADVLAEVKHLREKGEEYHSAGDHEKSMDTLLRAMEKLGVESEYSQHAH